MWLLLYIYGVGGTCTGGGGVDGRSGVCVCSDGLAGYGVFEP